MRLNNLTIENDIFLKRVILAVVILVIMTMILLFRVFDLQVTKYQYYAQESLDNQLIYRPIITTRGLIFDRNGVLLADNKLAYQLVITPEKISNVNATLLKLRNEHFINNTDIKRYNKRRKHYKKFQSIPLASNLSEESMTKILASQNYTGLDIKPYFKRIYPIKKTMSHIVGYIGNLNVKEKKLYKKQVSEGMEYIGKSGIEKQYDTTLQGISGRQAIVKNANGRSIGRDVIASSTPGNDLHLTIDIKLQNLAYELLKDKQGAIVLIDVPTGEVLVLASVPSFDANLFTGGISAKNYSSLIKNNKKPLFHRAISGVYPPGSTLKPFVALAGIESGIIALDYKLFCKGWYNLPNHTHKYRDWKKTGHGKVGLKQSIAQSCDVFFYDVSNKIGIDVMHKHLSKFNFGKKTNIDLPGELPGVLPSKAWKKRTKNKPWYKGETIIAGIGQGFVGTTPLQLAVSTAALANRGKLSQPRIVKSIQTPQGTTRNTSVIYKPFSIKDINNYEVVIDGMKKTVYGKRGTARKLNKNLNYVMAGKTGTAQVFGLDSNEVYIEKNIAKHLRDHALFTGFAPVDKPQVAIAIIVENAGSGSANAAPLAKKMLDAYFQ